MPLPQLDSPLGQAFTGQQDPGSSSLRDRYPDLYRYNDSSGMMNLEELLRRLKTGQLDENMRQNILNMYFNHQKQNVQTNMGLAPQYTRNRMNQLLQMPNRGPTNQMGILM